MRYTIILLVLALMSGIPLDGYAKGEKDTATFTVSGNCDMCKTRIETGAKKGGALKASWDEATHEIEVVYDPLKTTVDRIRQGIADAGYDNGTFRAPDAAYGKLPGCCQYERKKE